MTQIIDKDHSRYQAMLSFFSDGSSKPPRRKLIGGTYWIWIKDGDDVKFVVEHGKSLDRAYGEQSFAEPNSPAQFDTPAPAKEDPVEDPEGETSD